MHGTIKCFVILFVCCVLGCSTQQIKPLTHSLTKVRFNIEYRNIAPTYFNTSIGETNIRISRDTLLYDIHPKDEGTKHNGFGYGTYPLNAEGLLTEGGIWIYIDEIGKNGRVKFTCTSKLCDEKSEDQFTLKDGESCVLTLSCNKSTPEHKYPHVGVYIIQVQLIYDDGDSGDALPKKKNPDKQYGK